MLYFLADLKIIIFFIVVNIIKLLSMDPHQEEKSEHIL